MKARNALAPQSDKGSNHAYPVDTQLSGFKVEHTASNMGNGEWMITRNIEPRRESGGTKCVVLGVRSYDAYELIKLVEWLDDKATGYPKRDLPWPLDKLPQDCSHAGARTVDGRCENCGQSL